jgi:CoA:oxalate CoA-transferase
VEQEHPRFGLQRVIGLHVQLSETPGAVGGGAPLLGADTERVLRQAGYSDEEIERLQAEGAVALAPTA